MKLCKVQTYVEEPGGCLLGYPQLDNLRDKNRRQFDATQWDAFAYVIVKLVIERWQLASGLGRTRKMHCVVLTYTRGFPGAKRGQHKL